MPDACPVCQGPRTRAFLQRPKVPVGQNVLMPDAPSARALAKGKLALKVCLDCGFIFNAAFEPGLPVYDTNYDNTQMTSVAFEAHMDERVRHMVETRGERNRTIVEVGCGKGHFLEKLVAAGNFGVGFDTSYVGPASAMEGRLRFDTHYYGPENALPEAEVMVCRHVIEHVPDPVGFLTQMRSAIAPESGGRLYFETPCVDWILSNKVLWDFFYEHCSYFNSASLTTAFEAAGFAVSHVEHVFGGQYLWVEAALADPAVPIRCAPGKTPELAQTYALAEKDLLHQLKARLMGLEGGVALWGAGAKGVTLANLLDHDAQWLKAVVDLNPAKQGAFVPGTGHPIVGPEALRELGIEFVVLMNPQYGAEIAALIQEMALEITLLEVDR